MKRVIRFYLLALMVLLSAGAFAQTSVKANFGKYPADYKIAYLSMVGLTNVPSIKDLFGPAAKFATSFSGVPATITVEKAKGTADKFDAQLLLSVKKNGVSRKASRLVVEFESDSTAEASYCRYLKFVSLLNGQSTTTESDGEEVDDAQCLGQFYGVMPYFWDMKKYQ
jgi:hypothetical protein